MWLPSTKCTANEMAATEICSKIRKCDLSVLNLLQEPIVITTTISYTRYGKGVLDDDVQDLVGSLRWLRW